MDFRLYIITDAVQNRGRSHAQQVGEAARGGADLVQIRDKRTLPSRLEAQWNSFRAQSEGVPLVANDWPCLAQRTGSQGLHLGQEDLGLERARELAPDCFVGRSTHSLEQALRAEDEGFDYLALGPVFATQTKRRGSPPVGLGTLEQAAKRITKPWVAIGGIKEENLDRVLSAGACRVAVVTAVTHADNMEQAVRRLKDRLDRAA